MQKGLGLAKTFSDGRAYLEAYISHLQDIYEMKRFCFTDDRIDEFQLQYCKRMHGFLLLLPYSLDLPEPSIFLTWSFSEQRFAWDAAGSGLGQSYTEIRTSLEAIFQRFLPKVDMLTATPIASIENIFRHNGEIVHHIGLAYACAAANIARIQDDNPDLRGLFLPIREIPRLYLASSWNREVILYGCQRILKLNEGSRTVEREIKEQSRYRRRYAFHRGLVKPILRGSDTILAFLADRIPREWVRQTVLNSIPDDTEEFLDVSAGDHRASLEFRHKAKIVVLNDLVWDTLKTLVEAPSDINAELIFVNEDVLRAPFLPKAFDVVFCRNTLHHFSSVGELNQLLHSLKRWARRRVIIVEVMDPRESWAFVDWLRDVYYRRFLGDVGEALMKSSQIAGILKETFSEDEWAYDFKTMNTIGGRLTIWIATRREQ